MENATRTSNTVYGTVRMTHHVNKIPGGFLPFHMW